MDLKDRIALARKQAGLSQEQLGEKLGVSRQAVSKWESGQANPDVAYVTEMCRLFGVSSDWLLMGLDEGDQGSPAACPGCGGIVTPLDRFCPKCGQPLTSGQENSGYTLLLADSGEFGYQTYLAVSRLSGRPYARKGSPWSKPLNDEEVRPIVNEAPVILCRGLTFDEVQDAVELFKDSSGRLKVFRDRDGDTPQELLHTTALPNNTFLPHEKSGMTFGLTVLAVIVGVVAGILLLSFL